MAAQIDKVISELRDMVLSAPCSPASAWWSCSSRRGWRVAHAAAHRADRAGKGRPAGTAAVARFRVRAFTVTRSATRWTCAACWKAWPRGCWPSAAPLPEVLAQLEQAVEEGRQPLAPARLDPNTTVDARAWGQINRRFHEILCEAAGNRALLSALEHNNKTPLAGPAALTLPSTPSLLETPRAARPGRSRRPAARHHRREAVRAENLMRETPTAAARTSACCWNQLRGALARGRCWRTPALR